MNKKIYITLLILLISTINIFSQTTFVNPIAEGADPWVIKKDSTYYFLTDEFGKSFVVWKSDKLTDRGISRKIFTLPNGDEKWNTQEIWAGELHYIQGKWYIYYAAGKGPEPHPDNSDIMIWHSQRSGVLECFHPNDDPTSTLWSDKGMIYTGDDIENWDGTVETNIWAIDATPLEMNGKLYLIWSGWEGTANMENWGFTQQNLYIAEMSNPYTISSNRVKIAEPIYWWEKSNISPQKLNEGPQILKHEGKVYLVYSTPDYWTVEYKLGMIEIEEGKDPMVPGNWYKHPNPVFKGTDDVYSVGHGSFTTSPDGTENWLLYRTKQTPEGGWHRDTRLQKFTWNDDGSPNFGIPSKAGTILQVPSGEKNLVSGTEFIDNFNHDYPDDWNFYGWTMDCKIQNDMLWLGCGFRDLNNGEKVVLRNYFWDECTIETDISISEGSKTAGIIFGVKEPAFGKNAFKGFYAALDVKNDKIVLHKMDGENHEVINEISVDLNYGQWYNLKVEVSKTNYKIYLDDQAKIYGYVTSLPKGMAGLRIDETITAFDNFKIISNKVNSINEKKNQPEEFELGQNFPNPFNSSTSISYKINKTSHVDLSVYDIKGDHVETLINDEKSLGTYKINWNSKDTPSGIYFIKLDNNFKQKKIKCLLIK